MLRLKMVSQKCEVVSCYLYMSVSIVFCAISSVLCQSLEMGHMVTFTMILSEHLDETKWIPSAVFRLDIHIIYICLLSRLINIFWPDDKAKMVQPENNGQFSKKLNEKNIKIFLNKNKEANRKELPYCLEITPKKKKKICVYTKP